LVVRELALRGPLTARAIARGLPDVSMNQLVQRLAELEASGLVEAGPDGAYALTPDGADLEPVLGALARFGLDRLGGAGAEPGDAVVAHVLLRQLELRFAAWPDGPGLSGRFEIVLADPERLWSVEPGAPGPGRLSLIADGSLLRARAGACLEPDAVLHISVAECCALVEGRAPNGVAIDGDVELGHALLARLAPDAALAAVA
jgi:DNA-binding HxlR family transcriptional regulator